MDPINNWQLCEGGIEGVFTGKRVRVERWGQHSVRVRVVPYGDFKENAGWGLLRTRPLKADSQTIGEQGAELIVGRLRVRASRSGVLDYYLAHGDSPVLSEYVTPQIFMHPNHEFLELGGGLHRASLRFVAHHEERFYGLGQRQHGFLNQKGCVVPLEQRNSEVSVPFLLSSRGYGLLWHNPAKGRVELGRSETCWVAEATRQIDYVVIGGPEPAEILREYAELTGYPTPLPDWALGFWQSALRYETQAELLRVAHEHRNRGLPLSVIVIDFFHWTKMGEWRFDAEKWPDPAGMVRELRAMGVRLMVSIWPTVNPSSSSFRPMRDRGWLVQSSRGNPGIFLFGDHGSERLYLPYYDSTNPAARAYLWERVREGYHQHGVEIFWLDACEPDIKPPHHDNLRFYAGEGAEVANLYPREHARAFFEGMRQAGQAEVLNLCRSAWVGSQRFGAAVWSGDVPSTFPALRQQVCAGLNLGLCGIPWWTSDIGGFVGGKVGDPAFSELLVRWFQFGALSPIMRLHGMRKRGNSEMGWRNEAWTFGDDIYPHLVACMRLRERLAVYLKDEAEQTARDGVPLMRPLFVDYPADKVTWSLEDQYLLGSDLLVAPVLEAALVRRKAWLPGEGQWIELWTEKTFAAGQWIEVEAPLDRIPLFLRVGGKLTPSQLIS